MIEIWLRYDLRSPPFGTPTDRIIAAALDQAAWADGRGFHTIQLSEHHGSADGYNPSPMILGAAIAARTQHLRLQPSAIILPLHDPVRVAEDACVLDQLSRGRLDLTVGVGYVPREFEMFGVAVADRGRLADAKLEVLNRAFAGEPFVYDGRRGRVTPLPFRAGGPPIYVGGNVKATARRAARYGTGFYPMSPEAELVAEYHRACAELGKPSGRIIDCSGPLSIHVAQDPERDWQAIAPHAMHEANAYAAFARELGQTTPFLAADTPEALRRTGIYQIITPEACIGLFRAQRDAGRVVTIAPMLGGLAPELAWQSLELIAEKVIPVLQADDAAASLPGESDCV